MITRIAWASRKSYKLEEISTRTEQSIRAERFHRKTAPSPLCMCAFQPFWLILMLSLCTFRIIRENEKKKEADYIFMYKCCCCCSSSSQYTTCLHFVVTSDFLFFSLSGCVKVCVLYIFSKHKIKVLDIALCICIIFLEFFIRSFMEVMGGSLSFVFLFSDEFW